MFSGRMLKYNFDKNQEEVHMADAKVILIMIDALGYETAWARCGYLRSSGGTEERALFIG